MSEYPRTFARMWTRHRALVSEALETVSLEERNEPEVRAFAKQLAQCLDDLDDLDDPDAEVVCAALERLAAP